MSGGFGVNLDSSGVGWSQESTGVYIVGIWLGDLQGFS